MGIVQSKQPIELFDECPVCQVPTDHFYSDASVDMYPRGAPAGPLRGRRQPGHTMNGAQMADVVRRSCKGERIVIAPCCLQPFHLGCIFTWIIEYKNRSCPHCRAEMRLFMHLATDEQMAYNHWRESPFVCGFMAVGILATAVGVLTLMAWVLPLYAIGLAFLAIAAVLARRLCTLPIRRFHPIARPFVRALQAYGAFLVRVWRLEHNVTTGVIVTSVLLYGAMWRVFKMAGVV
jgi:hypothetical protein